MKQSNETEAEATVTARVPDPQLESVSACVVVHHRRLSGLPITIPGQQKALDLEAVELKRLQEKFKRTTPMGREIIRKLLARARRKLFGSPAPVGGSAEQFATRPLPPAEAARAAPTNSNARRSAQPAPVPQLHSLAGVNQKAKLSSKPPEIGPDPSSRASETAPSQPQVPEAQPPVPVQAGQAPTLPPARPGTEPDGSPTPAQAAGRSQPTLRLTGASAPSPFSVRGYSMAEARRLGLA